MSHIPHIYPPAPPTISGDILTISRFLNSPALVQRRLRTIAEQRFIADTLLTGRYEVSGGSILYEQTESIYTSKAPEAVNAGAEYPRSPATPGPAAIAGVTKWGQDVPITDEHVKRYGRRAIDVSLLKIVNYLVKQVDSIALTAIAAAVPAANQLTSVGGTNGANGWTTGATKDILLDLMLAKAKILSYDQGYDPDTIVCSDIGYARIVADSKIISGLAREAGATVVTTATGQVQQIGGMRILPTNNMPTVTNYPVLVLDSTLLGGLAYERLESPEYSGDPANGVESWTRRDPAANDQWIVRGRRPVVPIVQEPSAIAAIGGSAGSLLT